MNRALVLPAACFLVAFAALVALFHRATAAAADKEDASRQLVSGKSTTSAVDARPRSVRPANLLTPAEGRDLASALGDRFLQPWREWGSSPARMFSRVAPAPVPAANFEIVMAEKAPGSDAGFLLCTIAVTLGTQPHAVPCVVDRATRQIWLSADGRWLSQDEWLKQAPLPNGAPKWLGSLKMTNDE